MFKRATRRLSALKRRMRARILVHFPFNTLSRHRILRAVAQEGVVLETLCHTRTFRTQRNLPHFQPEEGPTEAKPLIFANYALYGASQIHDAGSGDPAYRGL